MQEMCQWGVIMEVRGGEPEPLFVSPMVPSGKAHGRAAKGGTKYWVCIGFGKANSRIHWPTHVRFIVSVQCLVAVQLPN